MGYWRAADYATVAAIGLAQLFVAVTVLRWPVTGDEPRYLLMAHSLVHDGDLNLFNNITQGDFRTFICCLGWEVMRPFGRVDTAYALHFIGLPLLIAPGYAVGGRMGATAELVAAGVATAAGTLLLARRAVESAWAARAATLLIMLSTPLLFYPAQVFPDLIAAVIGVWGVVLLARPLTPTASAGLGFTLAALPWLHGKFVPLLGVLYLLGLRRQPRRSFAALVAPLLPSYALLAWLYLRMYGHPFPNGPMSAGNLASVDRQLNGWIGLFIDRDYGLLVRSPVYVVAMVALPYAMVRGVPTARVAGALFLVFLLIGATNFDWWGGASIPPRYLVPALPLLAVPLAYGIDRARGWSAKVPIILLGSLSLGMAALALGSPNLDFARGSGDGENPMFAHLHRRIGGPDPNRLLPNFVRGPLVDFRPDRPILPSEWRFRGGLRITLGWRGGPGRFEVRQADHLLTAIDLPASLDYREVTFDAHSPSATDATTTRMVALGAATPVLERLLVMSE